MSRTVKAAPETIAEAVRGIGQAIEIKTEGMLTCAIASSDAGIPYPNIIAGWSLAIAGGKIFTPGRLDPPEGA